MARMHITRKISPGLYESRELLVAISEEDIPREEDETLEHHCARMHEFLFKQELAYLIFHGELRTDQARIRLNEFRKAYGLLKAELAKNGTKAKA